jgi:hypothetical protein
MEARKLLRKELRGLVLLPLSSIDNSEHETSSSEERPYNMVAIRKE